MNTVKILRAIITMIAAKERLIQQRHPTVDGIKLNDEGIRKITRKAIKLETGRRAKPGEVDSFTAIVALQE